MKSYDGEIGRGRRSSGNDSSSSRESSPARPVPKRAFSPPNSDDGDAVVQTSANDETPPPQPQPLIRQAMAFGSDTVKPPEVGTYEATPPPPPKGGIFLPGQQVPVPPKPKAARAKKAAASGPKRPRKENAYPGQTSRFRISTYDPTPSSEPPINHGTGPYSSLYRGATGSSSVGRQDSPVTTASSNAAYPTTSVISTVPTTQPSPVVIAQRVPVQHSRPPPVAAKPTSRHHEDQRMSPQSDYHSQRYEPSPPPSTIASSSTYDTSSSTLVGPYYRRNYEADVWEYEMSQPSRHHRSRITSLPRSSSRYHDRDIDPTEIARRSKFPIRMITLLIQDMRSGTTDHQLTEVKVPLRPGSSPDEGFWADARDISEQLQSGPSRIDGPARAYTLRGKYRQFILRVTADNNDEFRSINVIVQPDKTLDIIVETLQLPGARPQPPRIPTEPSPSAFDDYNRSTPSDRMDVDSRRGTPPPPPPTRGVQREQREHPGVRDSRKRMNSPSFDDYDGPEPARSPHPIANKVARRDYAWELSPRQEPRHTSPQSSNHSSIDSGPPRQRKGSTQQLKSSQISHKAGQVPQRPPPSPSPQPEVVNGIRSDLPLRRSLEPADRFMLEVEQLVEKEDRQGFQDFFRAKAGSKYSDILKQYNIILKLIKRLVGRKISGFEYPIEETHIVQAMHIEDDNYLSNCKETMRLMDLYGEKAVHYHDPRVTELVEDPKPVPYNVDPHKKILRFLREIDDAWHNGRKEPTRPQSSPPSDDEREAPVDSEPSRRGQRSGKGMFVA